MTKYFSSKHLIFLIVNVSSTKNGVTWSSFSWI